MQTFEFYADQKVTAWYRTKFSVEAESLSEAKHQAVDMFLDGTIDGEAWEMIDDTQEILDAEENGKQPTGELYSETDGLIITNEY